RDFAALGALVEFFEVGRRHGLERRCPAFAFWDAAAKQLARLLHVLDFGAVVGGSVERGVVQFVVWNRNAKARTEETEFVVIQLFLLVGDVFSFAGFAQPVALDRLGENDRRRSGVLDGYLVGGVHLDGIVAAQAHTGELLVGQVLDHLQ